MSPANCEADCSGGGAPSLPVGRISTLAQATSKDVLHSKAEYFRMFMVGLIKASEQPGIRRLVWLILQRKIVVSCLQGERAVARSADRPELALDLDVGVQKATKPLNVHWLLQKQHLGWQASALFNFL